MSVYTKQEKAILLNLLAMTDTEILQYISTVEPSEQEYVSALVMLSAMMLAFGDQVDQDLVAAADRGVKRNEAEKRVNAAIDAKVESCDAANHFLQKFRKNT